MVELLQGNTDSVRTFLAILAYYLPRTLIFILFIPLFTKGSMSGLVKSAIAISMVVMPVTIAFGTAARPSLGPSLAFLTLLSEVMLGSFLGLTLALPYYIFMALGALIDVYRGATFSAQVCGQDSGEQLPLESLFGLLFSTLILAGPGLSAITDHLMNSYIVFPPGTIEATQFATWSVALVKLTVDHFAFAILLSAPVLIIILLVEIAMEVLSGFTPQMQVYSLQFGLRSVFGIGALILMLTFAEEEIFSIFRIYSGALSNLVGELL